jgi:hypothetical protein
MKNGQRIQNGAQIQDGHQNVFILKLANLFSKNSWKFKIVKTFKITDFLQKYEVL